MSVQSSSSSSSPLFFAVKIVAFHFNPVVKFLGRKVMVRAVLYVCVMLTVIVLLSLMTI